MDMVSVSGDGNHVWGLNDKYEIFYRAGEAGFWEEVDGVNSKDIKQVSVNNNGSGIWAVTVDDIPYFRDGRDGDWKKIDGSVKFVESFGESGVIGINRDHKVYKREGL